MHHQHLRPEEDTTHASPVERSMEIEESTVKDESMRWMIKDDVVEDEETEGWTLRGV